MMMEDGNDLARASSRKGGMSLKTGLQDRFARWTRLNAVICHRRQDLLGMELLETRNF